CSVTVVDILQEEVMLSFAVDVVLPDSVCFYFQSHLPFDQQPFSCTASENPSMGSKKKIPKDEDSFQWANSVAKCVSLSIGDEFCGVVSHIHNPDHFFCQQMDCARELAELEASLNEYCGKSPGSASFRPAAGNMCCAQFTEDNLWYRAAVTAYASEDTVLVDYVDYGNSDSVPLTRLRPMIPALMDLPAQAITCSLAGIKPLLGTWTSEDISFMNKLVKDKVFTIKVVDKEGSTSVVELLDASVTPAISILSLLIEEGCAVEEPKVTLPAVTMGHVEQANEDTMNKRTFKWIKLTLKQTVNVTVCTVYTPGEFYCQISNNHELLALNSLNKSVSEYCQKTPPDVSEPENGEPCCAFFAGDGNWYRAVVQNVTSHGTVQVHFVDYGNVEEVPLDKIRQISPSFLKLPFQAIKCWLSGVKPGNSKWNAEAAIRFHMCTSGLELQATVTSLSKDGAGVVLIDNSTGCSKVINEILASENLAVKEVLQDENNFPNKSVDQKVTSLGHWKSIKLAVDEVLPVCVTEIVSPDLFYAVPVHSEVQKKAYKELASLGLHCRSHKQVSFQPKLGEACCAQFSGNGRWYRAIVLEASQSAVKVLYADYGNTETLPLSKVLPISDSFLKLPFQTLTCSLAGIEKAEWSPSVLNKLKEMLLMQFAIITVKEINGDVNLVQVEKHSENGTLNVADTLVKEGLVKSCRPEKSHSVHQGNGGETKCCCMELKEQLKKHEQVLLFLLNKYGNPDGFTEMKNLL
ncbi:TDRD1 protein, partial [Scytalopus superciliaris]|nr:TDRD1 protein [Scytalopus superciliaris]